VSSYKSACRAAEEPEWEPGSEQHPNIPWPRYSRKLTFQHSNSLSCWKARIWLPVAFKRIPDNLTKTCWSWAQFWKGQPTSWKT